MASTCHFSLLTNLETEDKTLKFLEAEQKQSQSLLEYHPKVCLF